MSKKILTTLIVLGLLVSVAVGGIYAYGRVNGKGEERGPTTYGRMERVRGFMDDLGDRVFNERDELRDGEKGRGLNLTDEQREKIREIMDDLRDKEREILDKIKETRDDERAVLDETPLNQDKINSLVDENISYIDEILDLREDGFVEIEKILTPEQREKYLSSFGFLTGRFRGRRGPKDRFEEDSERTIKDWLFLAKKLNLTEEQKKILNDLIEEVKGKVLRHDIKMRIKTLMKKLNITDEQKDSFINIFKDEGEKEKEVFKEIMDMVKSERDIVSVDPLNEDALRNSISNIKGKLNELLSLRKDMYLKILGLISDEQRKSLPTSIFFLSPGIVR